MIPRLVTAETHQRATIGRNQETQETAGQQWEAGQGAGGAGAQAHPNAGKVTPPPTSALICHLFPFLVNLSVFVFICLSC